MSATNLTALLSTLSLEEKISLLSGVNFWETVSIPEKGIPSVKMSDGPNGARGDTFKAGITSACFPAACSVASTFDVNIAHRVGVALGEETQTKGARVILAPTVCIHRHPLGGRNFESYSEDPYLSGKLATQAIRGIQSTGTSATIKHFTANEQETRRLTVDEKISERALREIYLKPFEIALKEANPGAIMTAYNQVNGCHADSHPFLLQQVLRGEWGWDGLVMSDWGGVNSTAESLNAGLDLEMPGPPRWRKVDDVLAAIKNGKVSEATIDERVLHILRFLERQNCFQNPTIPDEQSVIKPEHSALIREAGAKGIVLLKNQGEILPLTNDKLKGKKIAIFGYAKEALAHGGGSASVNSHYKISPWDALHEAFGEDGVEFVYAKGAHTFRQLPVLKDSILDLEGNPGFTLNIFKPSSSSPLKTLQGYASSDISLFSGLDLENKTISLEGTFTAPETATFCFTLSGLGPSKLVIDGEVIYDQQENCSDPMGFLFGGVPVPTLKVPMEAKCQYRIEIHTGPPARIEGENLGFLQHKVGMRLGCMPATEHDEDILSEAIEIAKTADYALVFSGHDVTWETEGQDQAGFNLPKNGSQDRLIAGIAEVNPNTIVVNSTGVAVAMPWLDQVQGLLQAWFPGQEAGHSIVDVLTGAQNPEGHLPCTFPKRLEDCPAHGNFPGVYEDYQQSVEYAEGVFVGYRHFDRLPAMKVNFPFGFGLSYTTFEFSKFSVAEVSPGNYDISVTVSNTGTVKGAVATQLYVGNTETAFEDPIKGLVAFKKVLLEAGVSATIHLEVYTRDFAVWDELQHRWVVKGGNYAFSIGKSAQDLVLTTTVPVLSQIFKP